MGEVTQMKCVKCNYDDDQSIAEWPSMKLTENGRIYFYEHKIKCLRGRLSS